MNTRPIAIIAVFLLAAGCAPQAELVKLRGEMNDLRVEVKDAKGRIPDVSSLNKRQDQLEASSKYTTELQRNMADLGARHDQLVTDLQIMQGKLDENNFRMKELAQKLDEKTYRMSELSARLDQLEGKPATAPAGTVAPEKKPEARTPGPGDAYQQAKTDYDKGNFDLAIAGFENYLKQFPDASQADSARYWIGECWYSKKDYHKAIEEFQKLLKAYPRSEKAPGARLKIGFSYLNEKNTVKAKEHLNKVIKDYPGTPEAEKARDRLKKLGK